MEAKHAATADRAQASARVHPRHVAQRGRRLRAVRPLVAPGGWGYHVYELVDSYTMRTNIVIDDKLMQATLEATGIKTKREAVEQGLRTLLRLRRQTDLRRLRGKYQWVGDVDAMRRDK